MAFARLIGPAGAAADRLHTVTRSVPQAFNRGAMLTGLTLLSALLGSAGPASADPGGSRGHHPPGWARGHERPEWPGNGAGRRAYPPHGTVLRATPPPALAVPWHGVRYRFHEGVWYAPAHAGWRVVRGPHGAVVPWLPLIRTAVVIGGLSYWLLNDTYYRERRDGGYEVVAAPAAAEGPPQPAAAARLYVYPARGQGAQQQSSDEYDCHRWAARQSGWDPSAQATGQGPDAGPTQREDYRRAQTACLEGRGYTVK